MIIFMSCKWFYAHAPRALLLILVMASLGIYTVSDLATADKYSLLKLRGYDFPQVTGHDTSNPHRT